MGPLGLATYAIPSFFLFYFKEYLSATGLWPIREALK
jgi:hypothetical protein